jgi:sulfate adenylyltransferase subunit 2
VQVIQVPHPSRYQAQAIESFMRGGNWEREPSFPETWESVKQQTGITWMASGLKKIDSLHRRAMMSQFPLHAIDVKGKRFYPLAFWSDSLVLRYLKQNRIPIPFSAGGKSFGIGFHPVDLRPIRDRFPEDYRKIVKEFPFAETMIMHEEMYGHDE